MNRIKELRIEKGLTQAELAELLGVHQTAVGKYEREELEPNIDTLIKLSHIFESTIDYILGNSDDFGNVATQPNLTEEEQYLLNSFRVLNKVNRERVKAYIEIRVEEFIEMKINDRYKPRVGDRSKPTFHR